MRHQKIKALSIVLGAIIALIVSLVLLFVGHTRTNNDEDAFARRDVQALIADLKNVSPNVRKAAAEALGEIKDPRAIKPLVAIVRDEGEGADVLGAATKALVRMSEHALTSVIDALEDRDELIQDAAAKILGEIKDPRAVEPLIVILKNRCLFLTQGGIGIESLEEVGDPRAIAEQIAEKVPYPILNILIKIGAPAVEPLINILKDENESLEIRWNTAWALGQIRDPRAIGPLTAAAKRGRYRVSNAEAALRTIEAFQAMQAKVREGAIKSVIATALEDKDELIQDAAIKTLGEIKDPKVVELLIDTLKKSELEVREMATRKRALEKGGVLWSMPRHGDEPAVLRDKESNRAQWHSYRLKMRELTAQGKAAVEILGEIGDPAVEPLIAALKDEDPGVRGKAREALIKIGAPAVEPLISILKDKNESLDTRLAIAQMLGDIGDPRAIEPLTAAAKEGNRWTLRRIEAIQIIRASIATAAIEEHINKKTPE